MKLAFKAGTTSKDINIFIQDSTSTTGQGLTGLVFNSASLTGYYHRQGASSATSITLATKTVGTWATGGFVAVDGTNMPGLYELGIPDAALASGATWVIIMLKGATNMAPVVLEIELLATDNQDAVRMGLTALPNANAAANGGLPTVDASNAVKVQSGTGANQISLSSGLVTLAGVTHTGATIPTVTTTGTATNVTTVNGLASGVITATSIAANAITAAKIATDAIGAAQLAADAVAEIQSGLATPTNITAGTITTVTNLTNAPTSGDFTATMKASITTAATSATPSVTVSDKTGFSLSSAGIQAIWDALTSALTTVGSIGKRLVDNLDTTVSSRLATAGYTTPPTVSQLRTEMDSNSTKLANLDAAITTRAAAATALSTAQWTNTRAGNLDSLDATVSSRLAAASYTAPDNATITAIAGYVDTEVAAIKAKTDNLPSDPASASGLATAHGSGAWTTADVSSLATASSITSLSNKVGTPAGASVSADIATVAGYIDTEVAAIKAKTDNLPASPAAVSDIPTTTQINTALTTAHGAGNWTTATGFATPTNVTDAQTAITTAISGLNDIAAADVVTALMAYAVESGKDYATVLKEVYAVLRGKYVANAADPTSIAFYAPDGTTERVTFALTDTTRTPS